MKTGEWPPCSLPSFLTPYFFAQHCVFLNFQPTCLDYSALVLCVVSGVIDLRNICCVINTNIVKMSSCSHLLSKLRCFFPYHLSSSHCRDACQICHIIIKTTGIVIMTTVVVKCVIVFTTHAAIAQRGSNCFSGVLVGVCQPENS